MQQAFVTRLYNGRYYVVEGKREDINESSKVVGEYCTRREAIRNGKREGYEIVIKNRVKAAVENDKTSLLDKLSSGKKRVAEQKSKPARSVAKSQPSTLDR